MSNQSAYKKYKQVQVKTANKEKLLIMLYQGCIKFLRLAKKGIEDKDIELANNYIIRSQNIIRELMNTLDREKGGIIADNLYSLYEFMNRQLVQANASKKVGPLDIVEDLLIELLDSWKQIVYGKSQTEQAEKKELNIEG